MPSIRFANRNFRLPGSRLGRVGLGGAFVVGGVFSFLPVLGLWMIPLGLVILSYDFPTVRRWRRRSEVWMKRRWDRIRARRAAKAE